MGKNREEKKEVAKVQPIDIARQAPTMILLNWKIKHTRIHTRQPRPSGQPVRCIIIIIIIITIIIIILILERHEETRDAQWQTTGLDLE